MALFSTFLEEVDRFGPLSGGWDWESSSDVTAEPTEILRHRSGISRLQNPILKTPVTVTLDDVGLALAVAACEGRVNG